MSDLTKILVRDLVNEIGTVLDCTHRVIASLIGVNESSISSNLDSSLAEVIGKKTGKRIAMLFLVVDDLFKMGLRRDAMMEALLTPIYPDLNGNLDSVKSSILQEKYHPSVLVQMAKTAYAKYTEQLENRESIGKHVRELMTA